MSYYENCSGQVIGFIQKFNGKNIFFKLALLNRPYRTEMVVWFYRRVGLSVSVNIITRSAKGIRDMLFISMDLKRIQRFKL